jgi:PAS domain S-box-containing protein
MQLSSQQGVQVLHVDDDPSITDLTGTFLEREGDRFAVETAISADEGLERINDRPPDCVVSDYNMPGMDGIEFLQAVRKEHPDLPFILFTGKGSEAVASDAISADVTDYLQKGSGTEQYELLANRIRNAVHARRETRRADRQEQLMRLTEFAGETGGFEIDMDSGDLLLTDGTRRLVGLSDDTQITLEEAIELYHPDDQADVRQTLNRAVETGEKTRGTWRLQTLDGDERLVNVTLVPATGNGDTTILRGAVHDVTERKKRRRDLEQVETWFQYAQDGLFLLNVDEGFTTERVNPAYEEVRGLSAEQVRGQSLRDILGDRAGAVAENQCRECVERRESLEIERTLQGDGAQTHYVTRIAPVVVDGTVEYIAGSVRDVTTQRERQQELQRLQQAIDDASVPITLADPSQEDNPLVYVNDAFEEMTGYPPEETLGRNCRFLQGEDTDSEKVTALREAIDNEEQISVELRNYRKDGTEFWNRLTVTPIYNDEDKLVRYLGTQEDVTERKERERELRAERRFIEQALDTLDDLFYVLNTDGTLRRWNSQVPQTTGYADSELADMQAIELFPEDDRETIADAIQVAVSGETVTVEAGLLTADGEQVPCEFTGAQLTDNGNTTGLVGIGRDLTGRRQRENRFQALVEESNDVISIVDADGVFQYQSPSVKRILGYEPEETIGDTAWEYVHPDDRANLVEAFERGVADPDMNPVVEYRARHADGSWCWLEANGNNQLDNPAVEGYIVNSRDITERKEREQELERTRDLLSEMEELAGVGAWEYDPDTDTLTTTAGARRIYGVDLESSLSLDEAFEFFHPEDRESLRAQFEACLDTGEPYEMDARLTTAEGTQRWVTARGERVDRPDSDSVVRGYIRDITEEKTREQELGTVSSQYQTLVENFPDGAVFLFDTELKYVRAGGQELTALGLSPEEVTGTRPHDLFPEDIAGEMVQYYQETLDGASHTFEQEYGGEQYRIQTTPVRTGDGEIDYGLALSQNVTAETERRQELKRQKERLEEFASIVSHDLRNPLRVADGRLELVQDECASNHIDDVAQALDRMDALIEDLLTLAREGNQVDEIEPIGLANVAEKSWQTVKTRQATLDVDTPQVIDADRSRIQQLFENLYRNAVEHGGDDVIVSVGAIDDGFYVADSGPGIPESNREDVFDAGYSTNEDGTGFGLRIVQQIAEAHGWGVTVTESEDGGARFEITGVKFADR